MELPIDARLRPITPKYIDEETPLFRRWCIFGFRDDGTVDISDGQQDIIIGVTLEWAQKLIAARKIFVDECVNFFGIR